MKNLLKSFLIVTFAWAALAMEPELAPFVEHEVKFASSDKNGPITLSGTLTLPKNGQDHPVVIFISGAGTYSRKEKEEPFDILAKKFAELGVASLYFDKRGCGESQGTFITAITRDFAQDVEKAIEYLKTIEDLNPNKIGLFGHSEGGLIATMLGAWRTDLAFIMLFGAPAIKLDELNRIRKVEQVEEAIKKDMSKKEQGQAILKMYKALDEKVQSQDLDEADALALANNVLMKAGVDAGLDQKTAEQLTNVFLNEYRKVTSFTWFKAASKINPVRYFELMTKDTPLLVVNGEADDVVPYKLNIPLIQKALAKAEVKANIVTLPNITHYFSSVKQMQGAGRPAVAKELMDVFTSWLKQHVVLK